MIKRIIAVALVSTLAMTAVSCDNNKKSSQDEAPMIVEKTMNLPGEWAKDYSRDEVLAFHKDILRRIEDVIAGYGFTTDEYTIQEAIKEENGISVNDNFINLDIKDPERLESMYYGFKQYGSDLASGDLVMKMTYKIDKKLIEEQEAFNFSDSSLSAFSEAFTNITDRDYTELNDKLYDMIIKNEGSIENNLDGLKETISIVDDILFYKLESKQYKFK